MEKVQEAMTTINKNTEEIKNKQTEMKNTTTEIKNTLERMSNRLAETGGWVSSWEAEWWQ